MDGIAITDMAALGSSPTYYDFDMFQEMQVTTGGADPANPTPGVQLNFVLRSGTNKWRASARYYYENNDLQSDNVGSASSASSRATTAPSSTRTTARRAAVRSSRTSSSSGAPTGKTNPAMEIYTYRTTRAPRVPDRSGMQRRGPAHPSAANTYQITARDCTVLENISAKADYNLADNWRASFTYFRGDKQKFGRGASATPRPRRRGTRRARRTCSRAK